MDTLGNMPVSDLRSLLMRFPTQSLAMLVVRIEQQRMYLTDGERILQQWPISTAARGPGNAQDSLQTPLGTHRIAEKIGADAPCGAIFKGRRNTGEIAAIHKDATPCEEDLVTTRILWLEGLEPGLNQGPGVDSRERFIYIHGTPEEGRIGSPVSHGCIRMRNEDVIALFDLVELGSLVHIMP